MHRYIALDVHAESTTCAVISSTGKRLKQEVVQTSSAALISWVKALPGRKSLVLEEGTQSSWLYETLSPFVDEMIVAIVEESKGNKSDAKDAWALAEQLRIGAIRKRVFKRPRELAGLRAAVRVHRLITSDMVRVKNRLRSVFRSRGVAVTRRIYDSRKRTKPLLATLPAASRYQVEMLGRQLDALEPLREQAEERLLEEAKRVPCVAKVATVPGFGVIRAATLVAVTITPNRFRTIRHFWNYAGLAIVTRTSSDWIRDQNRWVRAQVNQTHGLNKNRQPWLKSVLKGAALAVTMMRGHPLQADYERLLREGTKPNLARLTIARRLASAALACWRKQEEYDPSKHKSHIVAVS